MTSLSLDTADSTELILNVICCFSRIDFDLVSPYVASVLPIVAKVNAVIHVHDTFSPDYYSPALFFIKTSGRIS
jgi:hypothetical protein